MASAFLTLAQVREIGSKASIVMPAPPDSVYDANTVREWLFEDGEVWLIHRDAQHVYSMRQAFRDEIPQTGWTHPSDCKCTYCTQP